MGRFLSWWNRYESRLGTWASLLGLLGLPASWLLSGVASTAKEIVYAASWILLCLGGFIGAFLYCIRLRRKAKYSEVLTHLRAAVHSVVEESSHSGKHSLDEKKTALARTMDELSTAFSILTGSSCRCCIKIVSRSNKKSLSQLEVLTFCRNSAEKDAGAAHPIEHNTDFNDLYQDPSKKWFFGNNLPEMARRGEYNNTNKDWQKRYRATLVWPIRRLTNNPQAAPSLLGFLCVDSKRAEAFSEEFDYAVGAIVADALYPFLADLAGSIEPLREGEATVTRVAGPDVRVDEPASPQGVAGTHEH